MEIEICLPAKSAAESANTAPTAGIISTRPSQKSPKLTVDCVSAAAEDAHLKITTKDGSIVLIPPTAAARSGLLRTMMQECPSARRELRLDRVLGGPLERCLEYCLQDHLQNRDAVGVPVQFLFPLACSSVVDVCATASRLEIPALVHLTTGFIAAHIDQVGPLDALPEATLRQIVQRLPLQKLCRLQGSPRLESRWQTAVEEREVWRAACEVEGWEAVTNEEDPCWEAVLCGDCVHHIVCKDDVWRRTYVSHRLMGLEASLVSSNDDGFSIDSVLHFIQDCQSEIPSHAPTQEAVKATGMSWWDYLGLFESLQTLELRNWSLESEDISQIHHFLANRPQIQSLVLTECGISDDLMRTLSAVIADPGCQALKRLDLSGNYISAQGCGFLAEACQQSSKSSSQLRAIRLRRNFIGRDFFTDDDGGTFLSPRPPQGGGLGAMLEAVAKCPRLAFLDCSSNRIHLKDVSATTWMLVGSMRRGALESLDLSHNNLAGGEKEAGKTAVSHLFRVALKKTKRLVVQGSGLQAEHLQLSWVLPPSSSPMECLDISHNSVGDAGLLALAEAAQLLRLSSLCLSDLEASDQGALGLSECLAQCGMTRCIDISRNQLSALGIGRLLRVVGDTAKLEKTARIWLARCGIPYEVRVKILAAVWKSQGAAAYRYVVDASLNDVSEDDGKRLMEVASNVGVAYEYRS